VLPRRAHDYVWLGVAQIDLQTVAPGRLLRDEGGGILDRLDWYLETLVNFGLSTTSTGAWQLQSVANHLQSLPPDSVISKEDSTRVRNAALMVRETLYAETVNVTLYEVTGKRFDAKALIGNVPSLMRDGAFEQLPALSAFDLLEAATCIAFERPTAAAFHTVRATEGVLRHLYASVVKQKRIAKPWLWKAMTDDLSKPSRRKRPLRATLDHLDSIRANFRNPTQHPEKVYDSEEAQNLFAQCLAVIEGMVADPLWADPDDTVASLVPEPDTATP
jgi:hypothetical protein